MNDLLAECESWFRVYAVVGDTPRFIPASSSTRRARSTSTSTPLAARSPRSGREICEKMGARWVEALGVCEFEGKGE